MNILFSINFTGNPDADDVLAARHIVFLENKKRTEANVITTAENERRAALTPPGTPLPLLPILPTGTGAEIKASYLSLLTATVTGAHVSYIEQAKSATAINSRFTEAELKQIFTNLTSRLNAGESPASLVTDTAG